MSQLEEIISSQRRCLNQQESAGDELAEVERLVCFTYQKTRYAVHLDVVQEVVEIRPIMPYPEACAGHVGIVNIRSKVIPVIELRQHRADIGLKGSDALLLLEFSPDRVFALPVGQVKKVQIGQSTPVSGSTITVDSEPITVLKADDIYEEEAA